MDTSDSQPTSRVRPAIVRFASAAATHPGGRRVNADAFFHDDTGGFFAVGDGMADVPTSAAVSRTALAAVAEVFPARWAPIAHAERCPTEARERLLMGLALAHGRLFQAWTPKHRRIGTTFAGIVVCGELLVGAHVGDSRIHLLRAHDGRIVQVTEDHTIAGEAQQRGMGAEDAIRLPDANRLRQAVGASRRIEPTTFRERWAPGDIIVLCTDGVSDNLAAETIANIVLDAASITAAARLIVDRAVQGVSSDNAAVVLVHRSV